MRWGGRPWSGLLHSLVTWLSWQRGGGSTGSEATNQRQTWTLVLTGEFDLTAWNSLKKVCMSIFIVYLKLFLFNIHHELLFSFISNQIFI